MEQMRIDNMNAENITFMQNMLTGLAQKIDACKENLEALDPTAIMKRGYSAVTDDKGRFINTVKELKPEDKLTVHMYDGSADCTVDQVRGD